MRDDIWDAVIVGAGPAGNASAALLTAQGKRILFVEKKEWPRSKACGGCINAAGVRMLRERGLEAALAGDERAVELRSMDLRVGRMRMTIPTPTGMAVDRRAFDARLAAVAVARGAAFESRTSATLLPINAGEDFRRVVLTCDGAAREVRARVVLACDGQRGGAGLVRGEPWAGYVSHPVARVGFSATVADAKGLEAGVVAMFVSDGEYVGLVRLSDGRVHVGASLCPQHCHRAGGPGAVVRGILADCDFAGLDLAANSHFAGTAPLSGQRDSVAGQRVMVVGDACGYVEPFTGEGIAWAIKGACAAADILPRDLSHWPANLAQQWNARHHEAIVRGQWWCKRLRDVLHRPRLARTCMRTAVMFPFLPAMVARRIGA